MILLIGLLFLVVFTFFAGAASGTVYMFLDIASIAIILVPLIFFLIITESAKPIAHYIKSSF